MRKLFWQGIPPNVRGRVWLAALGNDLHITKGKLFSKNCFILKKQIKLSNFIVILDLFEIFRKRAADAKQGNVITSSSGVIYLLYLYFFLKKKYRLKKQK